MNRLPSSGVVRPDEGCVFGRHFLILQRALFPTSKDGSTTWEPFNSEAYLFAAKNTHCVTLSLHVLRDKFLKRQFESDPEVGCHHIPWFLKGFGMPSQEAFRADVFDAQREFQYEKHGCIQSRANLFLHRFPGCVSRLPGIIKRLLRM